MATVSALGPGDHGRPLTREEFGTAQWQSGYQYELIHGKLYVSPLPNLPQDWIEVWLWRLLDSYAQRHPEVINHVTAKARVLLPNRLDVTQPEPDLAAYRDFPRHRSVAQMDWDDVSPVLVAEVVSENDPDKDLVRNVDLYVQAPSIREYWVLDPRTNADQPTLLVYRRRGQRWQRVIRVPGGGTYTTRLLPGFTLVLDARG
jgi:Uma2 family endonuclease